MERAEEDEGGAHMTRKQSPNGRARSLVQQTAHHFSLILTSRRLEKTPKKPQQPPHRREAKHKHTTQHLWLVVRHTLLTGSPHISTFILSRHRVIECSLSYKDEAGCVCVCVWERSIDLSTAKRIKESEQACPSFCHVINIVSMSLFAALVTLSLHDAKHVSAVTETPWTRSLIGTKLIYNQAKNAQHWQVSAF